MKWIQKIFVVLFVVLASSMAMAYDFADAVDANNDGVGIAPYPVTGEEDMSVILDFEVEDPIYTWEKNGIEQSRYVGSIIPAEELIEGDSWEVIVSSMEYVGGYLGYIEVELGTETIEVESTDSIVLVGIPELDATDIHLTVVEGTLVDVNTQKVDNYLVYSFYEALTKFTQSTTIYVYDHDAFLLNENYDILLDENGQWQTDSDDAGVYEVIATLSDRMGHRTQATVTITVLNSGVLDLNDAPLATDIHLTVVEGTLVDVDMLQVSDYSLYQYYLGFTRDMVSDTVYTYDADGDSLKISYDSLLNLFGQWQTDSDDAGVYEVIATITDGKESTLATITITVLNSGIVDINECPVIEANDITVVEGELAVADFSATDEEGDMLYVSFTEPFNVVGEWQTEVGDAGEYTASVSVNDGNCIVSDDFTVTVEESEEPCEDLNNNGICDEDETEEPCEDLNNNGICDEDETFKSNFEGGLLKAQNVVVLNAKDLSSEKADEIKVYVEMQNDNSYDAEGIIVTLIFDGKDYKYSFQELDRSEVGSAVYSLPLSESLEDGRYPLIVKIDSSDINYETAFNLDIEGEGSEGNNSTELNFWQKIVSFFRNFF